MCTTIDEKITAGVRDRFQTADVIECWKVYIWLNGKIVPPFWNRWMPGIKAGEIRSNREELFPVPCSNDPDLNSSFTNVIPRERIEGRINQGIHVFLNEADAREFCSREKVLFGDIAVLVKVLCHKDDFVAAGNAVRIFSGEDSFGPSAVFVKITLPEEEYQRAFKEIMACAAVRVEIPNV